MEPAQILKSNNTQLEGEIWREIPDLDGYEASSLGRLRGRTGKLLSQSPAGSGYLRVQVVLRSGDTRQLLAHRAVLLAFVGPCPEGQQGAHLNGNRLDNRLENLKWCTAAENTAHKQAHGTATAAGEDNPNARLCDVARVLLYTLHIDKGMSCCELGRLCGLSERTVSRVVLSQRPGQAAAALQLRRGPDQKRTAC